MNMQGNISVPSGSGIDFSGHVNAAGMTSELLDDYEEGTWTPEVASVNAHHSRTGQYTKIGNMA